MHEITYKQLDEMLRSLGFTAHDKESGARIYKHAESGALLAFPPVAGDSKVYPHHIVMARMALDAFGIMSEPEFASRLAKAS